MSRPWLLVCLVFLIVFTSQFEWKQQFAEEIESTPTVSLKDQYVTKRQEAIKEKIILSQEKNIQKLNELVSSLRKQLLQCRTQNEIINGSTYSFIEHLTELEQQRMLDD